MTRFRFCFVLVALAILSTSCIASKPMLDYTPEEMRDKAVFEKVSPSILEIENYVYVIMFILFFYICSGGRCL